MTIWVWGSTRLFWRRCTKRWTPLARGRVGLSNSEPVPFRRYATPLKMVEYIAAGLPVLATELPQGGDDDERHQRDIGDVGINQFSRSAEIGVCKSQKAKQTERDRNDTK